MIIEKEIEKDSFGRLKITVFDDKSFVSTIDNPMRGIDSPAAGLRNDMFGMFPYETAYCNMWEKTYVVRHAKTVKGAMKNHTEIVNLALKGKKDWETEHDKAFERLLKK